GWNFRTHQPWLSDRMIVFLRSLDPVRDLIEQGAAREVRTTAHVAVVIEGLTEERLRSLHEAKHCLGCGLDCSGWREDTPDPASVGLFEYHHLCDNGIAGPYGLFHRPARPLHVDQLPPDIRQAVDRFRLANLRFPETLHLQPLEFALGYAYHDEYLTLD